MQQLMETLKIKLIATLGLEDIKPEDIDPIAPLLGDDIGLGLDSIDVLELVVMIEKEYGVKIESKEMGQKAFASISSLAAFIQEHRPHPE